MTSQALADGDFGCLEVGALIVVGRGFLQEELLVGRLMFGDEGTFADLSYYLDSLSKQLIILAWCCYASIAEKLLGGGDERSSRWLDQSSGDSSGSVVVF